jgi:hypothetical protein
VSAREATEDALHDAAHNAFMAFWRGAETDHATALWSAYCVGQERYEQWLQGCGDSAADHP